ncbi:MAG: metal-dependent hydrolase [Rubricoccaceae bacterium]
MDSITQAALGAACGQAVLGHRVGRRAALWGALAGTLPDLDILAYPFLDTAAELAFHRGPTHALLFAPVVAPVLGVLVWGFYRRRGSPAADAGWRAWAWLFFWALWTHPILDVFTVYGTQIFWPFSDYPAEIGSVFIIDPLYTLPLLVAVGVGLYRRSGPGVRRAAAVGLAVSTAYLGWSLVAQQIARQAIAQAYAEAGIATERILVAAAPLTTFAWYAVGHTGESLVPARARLFASPCAVRLGEAVPRATWPADLATTRGVRRLEWFSHGYLARVGGTDRAPVVADVRFGQVPEPLRRGDGPAYTFAWQVRPPESAPPGAAPPGDVALEQQPVEAAFSLAGVRRALADELGRGALACDARPAAPAAQAGPRGR